MFYKVILVFLFAFLFVTPQANAIIVAGVVRPGGYIPENSPIGASSIYVVNVNQPPDDVYLFLNGSTGGPGYAGVGDYVEVSNPETGKTIYFDSNCSSVRMPPLNLRSVLDPAVFERNGYQYLKFTFINKCSNAKTIDYLYYTYVTEHNIAEFLPVMIEGDGTYTPTPTPTPSPSPMPLVLTDFKQTDPQWGNARLSNSSNCGTMYGFGCAVTSVADVFNSYGKKLLPSNISLDPGTLNNWLANYKGFQACAIIWSSASSAVKLGAPNILFRNNVDWTAGRQAIDNALSLGHLPILGINTRFGTHFLVVSEKLPDVDGKPDYKLVDPAQYPFIANNPGNSGKSLSQVYGGFDKVFETVIYKPDSTMQNTLTIRAHSPVQLLITDPEGNRTGYDTDSQNIIEDIPESAYGVEPGIAPIDGSAPASPETKYFQQINPTNGEYNVQVIGTGDGSYTLDFAKTDEEGNTSLQIIKGFAQTGITESYVLNYTPDASQTPSAVKEVTFDTLKDDLNGLYNQKQIKNKLVYQTLLLQANLAERATQMNRQPLGNKLAIIPLKTFQLELNRQRGKQITEEAYQILTYDITYLINILQGNPGSPTPTPQPGGS